MTAQRAGEATTEPPGADPPRSDRRTRRRQQTIEEILDIAIQVMTEYGSMG